MRFFSIPGKQTDPNQPRNKRFDFFSAIFFGLLFRSVSVPSRFSERIPFLCSVEWNAILRNGQNRFGTGFLVKPVLIREQRLNYICLITERSLVRFPLGAWLFSLSILSYVYLTRYLEEVQHYLFSYHAAWGKTSLISTFWDLKKELLV